MSERLGISIYRIDEILERLMRLGLIHKDENGKVKPKEANITTSYDVPNNFIKNRHKENLCAAEDALLNVDVLLREFSFTTMAIDPKKIPEAKLMIRNFRRKLCEFLESGEKTEVYELCVQMFPRTQASNA